MPVRVEVFISEPPCSGGGLLLNLIEKIGGNVGIKSKLRFTRNKPQAKRLRNKRKPCSSHRRGNTRNRVCPSEETSKGALRGAGDNSIGRRYQADLARSAIPLKVVPTVEVLTFHYFRAPL